MTNRDDDNLSTAASEARSLSARSISTLSETATEVSGSSSSSSEEASVSSSAYASPFESSIGTTTDGTSSLSSTNQWSSMSSFGSLPFGFLSSFEAKVDSVFMGPSDEYDDGSLTSRSRSGSFYDTSLSSYKSLTTIDETDEEQAGFEVSIVGDSGTDNDGSISSWSGSLNWNSTKELSSVSTNILEIVTSSSSSVSSRGDRYSVSKSIGTISEADAQTELMNNLKTSPTGISTIGEDDHKSVASVRSNRSSTSSSKKKKKILNPGLGRIMMSHTRSNLSQQSTRSSMSQKSTRSSKSTRSTMSTRSSKSTRSTMSQRSSRSTRSSKSTKSTHSQKSSKSTKSSRSTKSSKSQTSSLSAIKRRSTSNDELYPYDERSVMSSRSTLSSKSKGNPISSVDSRDNVELRYISEVELESQSSTSSTANLSQDDDLLEHEGFEVEYKERQPYKPHFERGDHVYQWCSVAGVPYVFQHHGIVMHVSVSEDEETGERKEELTIADFSNFLPEDAKETKEQQQNNNNLMAAAGRAYDAIDWTMMPPSAKRSKQEQQQQQPEQRSSFSWNKADAAFVGMGTSTGGILRVYTTTQNTHNMDDDKNKRSNSNNSIDIDPERIVNDAYKNAWHKVEYGAPRWKTMISRSGISTTVVASDPPEVVLNRVNFLLVQAEREANDTFRSSILPKYHLIYANCECVATWCKTGQWSTLQGAAGLAGATWGGTMAIGRAAAASEATAAAAPGLMSYLSGGAAAVGGSTAASWVVPAMAAYGAITLGGSATTLLLARSKWKETTDRLNEALEKEHRRATPLNVM